MFLFVLYIIVSAITLRHSNNNLSSIVYKPKTFSKKAFFQSCRVRRKIKQTCKKNTTKLLIQQLLILSGTVERNPGPWTCSRCSQVFKKQARFQKHVENQVIVSCQHCEKIFCHTDRCRQHERTCSKNSKATTTSTTGPWTCTRCEQIFKHSAKYQNHIKNREFVTCRYCERNFCRKDRCEQHERTEHTQAVRKSLLCEYETIVIK